MILLSVSRIERNCVARMRFSTIRFVVYLQRAYERREALRKTLVGYELAVAA